MGPMILALLAGILYLIEITIIFYTFTITKRAKLMFNLWLLNLPVIMIVYVLAAKHGLMSSINEDGIIINFLVTLFFYAAGFFGGILQLYNLADRGFSLRILIDLHENKQGAANIDEITQRYSNGNSVTWMYQKRINDMVGNNLITVIENTVYNTKKGMILAKLFQKMRLMVNLN